MALSQEELFTSASRAARARITPDARGLYVATFAADAGIELLIAGCPVSYNESTDLWVPYTQPSDAASYTITSNATPASAGTFDVIINGHIANFAYDTTAANMQTVIRAVLKDVEPLSQDITVAATAETDLGDASAVVTIVLPEGMGAPSVRVDMSALTGNAHVTATVDAGTQLNGTDKIRAVVFELPVQIDASDEVLGIIMVKGEAERDDMNTAAVRALLRGSPSEGELDTALGASALKDAGIMVRGLSTVH